MRVVTDLAELRPARDRARSSPSARTTACTSVTRRCCASCASSPTARGHEAVCLTFDRHPAEVVRPESAPKLLTVARPEARAARRRPASSTARACSPSTRPAARSRPRTSSREVLVGRLGARLVIVGADFHFGHRRHGNVRLLEQMGAELGFEVLGLGLVPIEGDAGGMPYSSTRIRQLLAEGRVADAARPLRPPAPAPRGAGDRRESATGGAGSSGFPTANVAVPARVVPPRRRHLRRAPSSTPTASSGPPRSRSGAARPSTRPPGSRSSRPTSSTSTATSTARPAKVRFVERLRGEERFDCDRGPGRADGPRRAAARRILGLRPRRPADAPGCLRPPAGARPWYRAPSHQRPRRSLVRSHPP